MTKHLTLAALIATLPMGAYALSLGDPMGKTEAEIRATLERAGYTVTGIEVEADDIEAELLIDGMEVEVEIDPATGLVVALETEEADDGDADDDDDQDGTRG